MFFIFWLGRNKYVHVPPTKSDGNGFLNVVKTAFTTSAKAGQSFWDRALEKHGKNNVEGAQAVWNISNSFFRLVSRYYEAVLAQL